MPPLLRALLVGLPLAASGAAHAHAPREGVVQALSTPEGLPLSWVSGFLQDEDGGLWIGTDAGLVWFDGVSVVAEPETRGSKIVQLVRGASGGPWVVSEDQAWRLEDGALAAVSLPRSSRSLGLVADTDGGLWASDGEQLVPVDPPGAPIAPPDGCGQLALMHNDIVRCTDTGAPLEVAAGALRPLLDVQGEPLPAPPLLLDGRGVAWVPGEGQLRRYLREPRGFRELAALPALALDAESVHEAASGEIWIATLDRRVVVWDGAALREHTRLDHLVRTFFEDRDGSLWVATRGHGALRLTAPRRFSPLPGAPGGRTAWTSVEDAEGVLWLGTDEGLLRRAPGEDAAQVPGGPDTPIYALAFDADGALLAGGVGGVWRWEGGALRPVPASDPGLSVRGAMLVDGAGRLWVGGRKALWRNRGPGTPLEPVPLPVSLEGAYPPIGSMVEDPEGRIWVATNAGLLRWTGADLDVLPVGHVRGLALAPDGAVWATRARGGLLRIAGDEIATLGPEQGAPDAAVHAVLFDAEGGAWMPGNRGVDRVSAEELSAAISTGGRVVPQTFGTADGLPSAECNSGHPAARLDGSGQLHVATMLGPAVLDPGALAADRAPPAPRMLRLEVDAEEVPLDRPLAFPAGTRSVALHYTAPELRDPDGLRFRYRLDGYDEQWVEAGDRRVALWTGLPAGAYTVLLEARHIDGAAVGTATLPFSIEARLVDRLWFRLLLGLGGLSLVAVLVRAHLHRVRERELTRLVEARTAELRAARDAQAAQAAQLEEQATALAAQAAELAAVDARRSRFFANVSHELRTPLTLIRGPVDGALSAGGALSDDDLARVGRSARRLEARIEELLDVARLEAGRLPLAAREGDLRTLAEARVAAFADLARAGGVSLSVEGPAVAAWFDPPRLEKVLDNLLANAIRHTPEGGAVRVRTDETDAQVRVSVEDTGPGVDPAHLPHIFERFYQAPGGRGQGSAGLGLALSRELVRRHGGDLEVERRPGAGATFTLRLPHGRDHLPDADIATGEPSPVEPGPAPTPAPGPTGTGETVLLVEDDAELRAWLRQVLARRFAVLEAADGAEGLELARERVPDLVLTDAMMPGMDGLELLRALRADPATSHLPVVMLSARTAADRRVEGLAQGADAYLGKPVHPDELLLQVGNLLEARARLRARHRKQLVVADDAPAQPSADERFLAEVRRVVTARMADEEFGVQELAQDLHLSRRQLNRKLQALTGAPPSAVLREVRLERARALLDQGAGTIAEIGYAVGFRRPARFSEAFRAAYGVSPSGYRDRGEE